MSGPSEKFIKTESELFLNCSFQRLWGKTPEYVFWWVEVRRGRRWWSSCPSLYFSWNRERTLHVHSAPLLTLFQNESVPPVYTISNFSRAFLCVFEKTQPKKKSIFLAKIQYFRIYSIRFAKIFTWYIHKNSPKFKQTNIKPQRKIQQIRFFG